MSLPRQAILPLESWKTLLLFVYKIRYKQARNCLELNLVHKKTCPPNTFFLFLKNTPLYTIFFLCFSYWFHLVFMIFCTCNTLDKFIFLIFISSRKYIYYITLVLKGIKNMKSKKLYIISLIIVYSINLYFYFQSKDLKIILITILLSIPL